MVGMTEDKTWWWSIGVVCHEMKHLTGSVHWDCCTVLAGREIYDLKTNFCVHNGMQILSQPRTH